MVAQANHLTLLNILSMFCFLYVFGIWLFVLFSNVWKKKKSKKNSIISYYIGFYNLKVDRLFPELDVCGVSVVHGVNSIRQLGFETGSFIWEISFGKVEICTLKMFFCWQQGKGVLGFGMRGEHISKAFLSSDFQPKSQIPFSISLSALSFLITCIATSPPSYF